MKLVWLIGFVLGFACCAIGQGGVFERTDTQKEIELGQATYQELFDTGRLSRNEPYIRRVQRIFNQLISALPEKLYSFQAVVVANNELNAWCAPGGYIAVFEGTVARMPDDNQLAYVLAHEIGHGVRRHTIRTMRRTQSQIAKQAVIAILLGTRINDSAINLARLSYSREFENEADSFGVELYLRAGFDPKAAGDGMKRMVADDGGDALRCPDYLQTHPDPQDRLKHILATRDKLIASGLRPLDVSAPDLSIESVFGKIPTIAPRSSPWMKAQPGEVWQYEVSGGGGGTSVYRLKAVGLAVVGSTSIYRMELEMTNKPVTYQMILDGDRIWRRNRPTDTKSPWTLEAVLPEVGLSEGDEKRSYFSTALETVETPAGKFENCLLVKQVEGSRTLNCWYAPGVGLVKRVNPATGLTEVLVSHKLP